MENTILTLDTPDPIGLKFLGIKVCAKMQRWRADRFWLGNVGKNAINYVNILHCRFD